MKAFGFTIVLTSFLIASSMPGNALSIPQADVMAANDTIRVKKRLRQYERYCSIL